MEWNYEIICEYVKHVLLCEKYIELACLLEGLLDLQLITINILMILFKHKIY